MCENARVGRLDTEAEIRQFWDRESETPSNIIWMADPRVREYINERISGSPYVWPMDWFIPKLAGRRFQRGLSIGCGTGPFERDLITRNLCDAVDAFDGSSVSIATARRLASEAGVGDRIHYYVGDFNAPRLPRRTYDLVVFHQSLHHVAKLERLLRAVLRSMRPDGLLYLDEYVGPSRFDWNDQLIAPHRAWFYRHIPPAARLHGPLTLPVHPDDPSEALRSDEIFRQISRGFRILDRRDYGGTLISVIFPMVKWDHLPDSVIPELIEAERQMIQAGASSYYAVAIAAPKRGIAAVAAHVSYWVTSKLRRLRWEWRKLRAYPETDVKF